MTLTRHALRERQIALVQHYLDRLDNLHQRYTQGQDGAQEALRAFDQDLPQLQTQQRWSMSLAHRDADAAQLVILFPQHARTLLMQMDPREAAVWLDDALICVEAEDFKTRYHLLLTSYEVQKLRRDTVRMREILNDLEALANRLDEDDLRAKAACLNAEYYDMVAEYENQLLWAERALSLALHVEDRILIADAHHQLGFACVRVYEYDRATDSLRQALTIYQEAGLRLKEAFVLSALAMSAYYTGRADDAVMFCEQALSIVRELGHRTRELNYLSNLAIFTMGANDLEKSLLYGQQAWNTARETGNRNAANAAVSALLVTGGLLGLPEEMSLFESYTREFLAEDPYPYLESVMESALSELAYEQEDWHKACDMAAQTAAVDRSYNDSEREFQSTWIWANSLIDLGLLDEAAAAFSRCIELHELDGETPFAWSGALAGLSYVEARRENHEEAQKLLDTFLALLFDDGLSKILNTEITLWNAARAAIALDDSRLPQLREQINKHLEHILSHLTDERLRAAFLKKYTTRSLGGVLSGDAS